MYAKNNSPTFLYLLAPGAIRSCGSERHFFLSFSFFVEAYGTAIPY
jgi:hypothetical protein